MNKSPRTFILFCILAGGSDLSSDSTRQIHRFVQPEIPCSLNN